MIGIYELPFGRGKKFAGSAPSAVNHIVSNWMLAGTYVCRTGIYFTPSYAGVDPSNTNRRSGRPDRIADGNLANDQRTLNAWFNAAAFALPPAGVGRFGASGNHVLEGPGLSVFHFGATKEIPLHERARLKLEMVSTNFFNHPNFGNPSSTVGTTTFGRVLSTISTYGNRDFQLTARFIF